MLRLAAILCLAACLAAGEPAGPSPVVVDRPLRYVNNEVITLGDVLTRTGERADDHLRRGLVLPDRRDGMLAFQRASLDELTDEALLVQRADELKVRINRDFLMREVLDDAKRTGMPLEAVMAVFRRRERQGKIDALLGWFDQRSDEPTPQLLESEYARRKAEFRRPARARVSLILVRPTEADERAEIRRQAQAVFKAAQEAADPALRNAAASRLDAYLAAPVAEQERLLAEVVAVLAREAGRTDLDAAGQRLAAQAAEVAKRQAGVRDVLAATALLGELRTALLAMPSAQRAEVFAARARTLSQGPQAAAGGSLGWIEPGSFGAVVDRHAFATVPGEPSPVWQGENGVSGLLLVHEREEARQLALADASAQLLAALERQRRERIRAQAVALLRQKASLRDLLPLAEAIP